MSDVQTLWAFGQSNIVGLPDTSKQVWLEDLQHVWCPSFVGLKTVQHCGPAWFLKQVWLEDLQIVWAFEQSNIVGFEQSSIVGLVQSPCLFGLFLMSK